MTPLGRDVIRLIFAGGASLFGYQDTYQTQRVLKIAGERLWGNLTSILRHPIGHRMVFNVFPMVDPGSIPALKALSKEPGLEAGKGRLRLSTFWRLARFMVPMLFSFYSHLLAPNGKVAAFDQKTHNELAKLQAKIEANAGETPTLARSAALVREMRSAFIFAVPNMLPAIMAGMMPITFLNRVAKRYHGVWHAGAGDYPWNAQQRHHRDGPFLVANCGSALRSDPAASARISRIIKLKALARQYLQGELPETAQRAIQSFLACYGMRGIAEIDFGRARWRENPTQIMQVLGSYLQIEDAAQAPDAIFRRGEAAAEAAITELENAPRRTFAGGLKARLVRAAARRVRTFAGLRESPKLHIIKMMGMIRHELLRSGEALVREGVISCPDDLCFLESERIRITGKWREMQDWAGLIGSHRAAFEREMLRLQVPRLLLSDGRTFYEGITSAGGTGG